MNQLADAFMGIFGLHRQLEAINAPRDPAPEPKRQPTTKNPPSKERMDIVAAALNSKPQDAMGLSIKLKLNLNSVQACLLLLRQPDDGRAVVHTRVGRGMTYVKGTRLAPLGRNKGVK